MRIVFVVVLVVLGALGQADCRNLVPARNLPAVPDGQWSMATLNLWRLRDDVRDGGLDDPLDTDTLNGRLDALAAYISGPLQGPSLLALQEVENRRLLEALAERLKHQGLTYQATLLEGNDPAGMDVGVLSRTPVHIAHVQALFAEQRFAGHALYSRPPLQLVLDSPWPLKVIVVHMRSARGLEKEWVRVKRQQQAALLADWAARQQGALVVLGDFNSGQGAGYFSDSYQRFARSGLYDVWQRLPESERYSFRYRCRPSALDHIWVNKELQADLDGVAVTRGNAGRYRQLYDSQGRDVVSDHEALSVTLPLKRGSSQGMDRK
ncbi:hypothetical protein A11A3_02717 [Alcanivorax hongdengensis A-11-3]|uniref:Endonuclease/exonuclease/phosphatase domain-containing protein n=1 Tax=Alcanivorax hongdengensis A-11-3 TaxID=1177179 RepID=L0WFD1_9GAMM|nr:endonuclease/exonuclease/phosphatase family protein [Alcanivorax hongdengensis]EKF75746.1 hypothetical protein A11A3_02717 [Alcanivorax hongdengensis A-11-3]